MPFKPWYFRQGRRTALPAAAMVLVTSLCVSSEQASDAADFSLAGQIQLFLRQLSGQHAVRNRRCKYSSVL